jgi:lysophospholipase L1-like esterase
MTLEAAQWRDGYDAGLAFQAGFFPAQPTTIDQPIPVGDSGLVTLPASDSDGQAGPYFTNTWTFVPHQDAVDPFVLFRTARTNPEPSRIVVNRIRLEEHRTDPREPLRILCVGDSITAGYTSGIQWEQDPFAFGYRSGLFARLLEHDIPCQFVGSSPQPYNLAYDILPPDTLAGKLRGPDLRRFGQDHHQGWAGAGISGGIQSNIVSWIEEENPDVLLLMVGINAIPDPEADPVEQQADLEVLVQTILDEFAEDERKAHLIVAQITPRSDRFQSIVEYNRFIREDLVPRLAGEGAPISTVDQYANFLDANGEMNPAMFAQINHPSNQAYVRMAQTWFDGLLAAGLANRP